MRMMDPLPNARSICVSAASRALFLSIGFSIATTAIVLILARRGRTIATYTGFFTKPIAK